MTTEVNNYFQDFIITDDTLDFLDNKGGFVMIVDEEDKTSVSFLTYAEEPPESTTLYLRQTGYSIEIDGNKITRK